VVTPRKTGQRRGIIRFFNAGYAQGVQDFSVQLRVLMRATNYIVAEIIEDSADSPRTAIISHIEFEWIRLLCPELWNGRSPERFDPLEQNSVSLYLHKLFPHLRAPNEV
jgi:hypothetical protein